MIDAQAPIYIQYQNISTSNSHAEYQKDIMSLAFQKMLGENKIISERPLDGENDQLTQNQSYWVLKCLSCAQLAQDEGIFIADSLKKKSRLANKTHEISFDTLSLTGKTTAWTVQIAEVKPILVRAGDDVKISMLSLGGISIQSIGKSLKNGAQGDTVSVRVDNWFHKANNVNSTKMIDAKVTATNEVEYVASR